MKDINIPKEILARIKELKISNCIISKNPQKPIQLAYRSEKGITKEFFYDDDLQRGFIIEVFLDGKNLKLYLTSSS